MRELLHALFPFGQYYWLWVQNSTEPEIWLQSSSNNSGHIVLLRWLHCIPFISADILEWNQSFQWNIMQSAYIWYSAHTKDIWNFLQAWSQNVVSLQLLFNSALTFNPIFPSRESWTIIVSLKCKAHFFSTFLTFVFGLIPSYIQYSS